MLALKMGNAGHGLEVYDTETGKYAEVSITFEGRSFNNFDDFKKFILDAGGHTDFYNHATDEQRKILDEKMWEPYKQLLTDEVNKINAEQKNKDKKEVFDTVDDVVNKAYKIFDDEFVQEFFSLPRTNNKYSYFTYVLDDKSHSVSTMALLLQKYRYNQNKMNRISKQEYDDRIKNITFAEDFGDDPSNWTLPDLDKYVSNKTDLPLFRGMIVEKTDSEYKKNIVSSFYENGENKTKSLLANGANGYYGSVTYMSVSKKYAKSYAKHFGDEDNGVLIKALCKNPSKLKILKCNEIYNEVFENNPQLGELSFKSYILTNKVETNLKKYNKFSQDEIDDFIIELSHYIENDVGFAAMLFGYDALMGIDGQFDILNPGVVDVCEYEE